jgi:hypothetical protein
MYIHIYTFYFYVCVAGDSVYRESFAGYIQRTMMHLICYDFILPPFFFCFPISRSFRIQIFQNGCFVFKEIQRRVKIFIARKLIEKKRWVSCKGKEKKNFHPTDYNLVSNRKRFFSSPRTLSTIF